VKDSKKFDEIIEKNLHIIEFMSKTIDNFINFFKSSEDITNFSVKKSY
jgi:hypothetical protein